MEIRQSRTLRWSAFLSAGAAWMFAAAIASWVGLATSIPVLILGGLLGPVVWLIGARLVGSHQTVPPSNLPPTATNIVGRDVEFKELQQYLTRPDLRRRVAVVSGAPGIGKTTLAVYTAHRVASLFKAGELFARLDPEQSISDNIKATRVKFIKALSRPSQSPPKLVIGQWLRYWYLTKTLRSDRQLLVVLDEVADDREVRALVPHSRWSAAIVVSRKVLPGIDTPHRIELKSLDDHNATELLASIIGRARVEEAQGETLASHSSGLQSDPLRTMIEATAGHPLAIRLVGMALANRPHISLSLACARMIAAGARSNGTFDSALDLSFYMLTYDEQEALIALGLIEDGRRFAAWELGALLDLDERNAWRYCDRLTDAGLLERRSPDATGVQYYRQLEHVATYAQGLHSRWAPEKRAARSSMLADMKRQRKGAVPKSLEVEDIFRGYESGNISRSLKDARDAIALAREKEDAHAEAHATVMLAELLAELGGHEDVLDILNLAALSTAPVAQGQALRLRAKLHRRIRQLNDARSALTRAFSFSGDSAERLRELRELAIVESLGDDKQHALRIVDDAIVVSQRWPAERAGLAYARSRVLLALDRPADAETEIEIGVIAAGRSKQQIWQAWLGLQQALAALRLRKEEVAIDHARVAQELFGEMRHRYGSAHCRMAMGRAAEAKGGLRLAALFYEEALETFGYCGDLWAEATASECLAGAVGSMDLAAADGLLRDAERLFRSISALDAAQRVRNKRREGIGHRTAIVSSSGLR